jgi:hypothetical protein
VKNNALLLLASVAIVHGVQAQGTFQNLDFEMAQIVPLEDGSPRFYVMASKALPGWTAYFGSGPSYFIFHNTISAGSQMVSIHDSLSPDFQPLQGNYSVAIQHATPGIPTSAAIGQTGRVPSDAASLIFYAVNVQNLQATFAGNVIPLVQNREYSQLRYSRWRHFTVFRADG